MGTGRNFYLFEAPHGGKCQADMKRTWCLPLITLQAIRSAGFIFERGYNSRANIDVMDGIPAVAQEDEADCEKVENPFARRKAVRAGRRIVYGTT